VIEPDLLLLDEPVANLDRRLREQVRDELRALQRRTGVTTLLVTHDQEEALAMADLIGVLAAGRLLQVGTPREVYERPICPYVARSLGDANLLTVDEAGPGGLRVDPVPEALAGAVPGDVVLVRPERVRVAEGERRGVSPPVEAAWPARVLDVSYRGGHAMVELLVGQARLLAVVVAPERYQVGQIVSVSIPAPAYHLLPQGDPPGLVA
jgi:ABC-type Fe3+/spermidine/putrescine transport system ATPase subunit